MSNIKKELVELAKKIKTQERLIIQAEAAGNDVSGMIETLDKMEVKFAELEDAAESAVENKKREKMVEEHEDALINALEVYNEGLCLHLGSQVRYFYKKTIVDKHRITGADLPETSLTFFPANQLYPHISQMETKQAQVYLRKLIEGKPITSPDGEVIELESRTYKKLGNTRHTPGEGHYNLLDLSEIKRPSGREVKECPFPLRALLMSLSGNTRTLVNGQYVYSKLESMEWLEKWIYGAVCADIGNPMLGMPVIFGAGKIGKNAMFDVIFPKLLGTNLCFSSTWDTIDGNFNAFKIGKVFTFIDEVPQREDWNKLKNLTGSPIAFVKEKYGPEFAIENTIVNVIGSNETVYPLPVEEGQQMTRVSPIEADPTSLFATNIVEIIGQLAVASELYSHGINIQGLSDYQLGDTWLKQFPEKWQSDEVLLNFLDYLHTRYGKETYQLQQLQGRDWDKIVNGKKTYTRQVVDYVAETLPDYITLLELYQIYLVISGETNSYYQKKSGNLLLQITPELENLGYQKKEQVRVSLTGSGKALSQTTVFTLPNVGFTGLVSDPSKFILEEIAGTKTIRHLRYASDKPNKLIIRELEDTGFGDL